MARFSPLDASRTLTAACMMLLLFGSPFSAAHADAPDGSSGNPYLISTCADLQGMQAHLDAHYALTGDVDCSATNPASGDFDESGLWSDGSGFMPVGSTTAAFTGALDGRGFTISNLFIDRESGYVGIFALLDGLVSDLTLSSPDISGIDHVGALAGISDVHAVVNNVTITDGSITGATDTGALAGLNHGGSIASSSAATAVTGTTNVGGFVGSAEGGTIDTSFATGTVEGGTNVGGFIGSNVSGAIQESYATGDVNAWHDGTFVGGFVGESTGSITIAYASGSVTGGTSVGGFIGEQTSGTTMDAFSRGAVTGYGNKLGGFVGGNVGTIIHAFSAGSVTGLSTASTPFSVGGFAGDNVGTASSTFAASSISADGYIQVGGYAGYSTHDAVSSGWWTGAWDTAVGSGSGLFDTEFSHHDDFKNTDIALYADWDFDAVWGMDESSEYPRLNAGWPYLRAFMGSYTAEEDDLTDSEDSGDEVSFAGGNGLPSTPYLIDNCNQFPYIIEQPTRSYLLTTDLDCSEAGNGIIVGTSFGGFGGGSTDFFSGTFDGGGHSLTMTLSDSDASGVALFRATEGATIKDLNIATTSTVVGENLVGSIVGVAVDTTLIRDTSAAEVLAIGTDFTQFPLVGAGGLVGTLFEGEIEGSSFTGIVASAAVAGGIAGVIANDLGSGEGGIVSRSSNTGDVHTLVGGGGIVGFILAGGYIRNSYSNGNVSIIPDSDYGDIDIPSTGAFGGLAGAMIGGTISRSYAAGRVDAGDSEIPSGGLVGYMSESVVTLVHSFAADTVTASSSAGAVVGFADDGASDLYDNYFDTVRTGQTFCMAADTEGREDCTGVDGSASGYWLDTDHAPFSFWNAADVWDFTGSGEYPTLRAYTGPETEESDLRDDSGGGEDDGGDDGESSSTPPVIHHSSHHYSGIAKLTLPSSPDLQSQFDALLEQYKTLLAQVPQTAPSVSSARDLTVGSTGDDVKALQTLLIAQGYSIPAGATGYFGTQTKSALAAYQKAHGITPAAGYFGPITRGQMKW